jgi:transglutaminase/protease-like cytokinesis protein 3
MPFLVIGFCLLFPAGIYANVTIDTEKIPQGLARIQYSGDLSKSVKVLVEANGDKNVYSIRDNNANYVPLQMGEGTYKISVLQQIEGTRFKPLKSESIEVGKVDTDKMYSSRHLIVNFDSSMKAIQNYMALTAGKSKNELIKAVYTELVTKYGYDFDKIKNLPSDYVPIIDEVYASKKGICYDYAVMTASLLRHNGIPAKLVMGYAPDIAQYHAWNEILMDGKWVTVDTTYDSQFYSAGASYTFEKDAAARKVVKVY